MISGTQQHRTWIGREAVNDNESQFDEKIVSTISSKIADLFRVYVRNVALHI